MRGWLTEVLGEWVDRAFCECVDGVCCQRVEKV